MPTNWVQWLWFAFFFVGAIGGWLVVAMCAADVTDLIRRAREWNSEE